MQRFDKHFQKELLKALAAYRKTSYGRLFFEQVVLSIEEVAYLNTVLDRLLKDEPITKILQQSSFYGNSFYINQHVLDPRPDTETLIDEVLRACQKPTRILDLGTGSGCIIITLLNQFKTATAVAIDISTDALDVAQRNAIDHHVHNRITFIESAWFDAIPKEQFDCIVSNPPYIEDNHFLESNVLNYDPHLALFGGKDGLHAYRAIFDALTDFLTLDGLFFAEIGYNQGKSVQDLLKEYPLLSFQKIIKDLQNNDRVVVIKKNN